MLLLVWALENVIAERTGPTALLLYLPQQPFLLPSLGLLIWSLVRRRAQWALFNGAALLVFAAVLLNVHVPWARLQSPPAGATRVRVMTWNLRVMEAGVDAIAREIRAQNPDIVCVEETASRNAQGMMRDRAPELKKRFPSWHMARTGDVAIFSRWPLVQQQVYAQPAPNLRPLLATTWQTPGGPLRVLGAHISTAPARNRYGNRSPWSLRRVLETTENIRQTAQVRAAQLPAIDSALIDALGAGQPFLLAGDFNNPSRGQFYRHLGERMTDSFAAAGWGSGFSFPASWPVMRIDYIWLGSDIAARRSWTVPTSSSDHRALVSDVDVTWRAK